MPKSFQAAALILSFLCFAVNSSNALPQATTGLAEITIYVSGADGPIEGAILLLRRDSGAQRLKLTGSEGVCRFTQLEPGTYSLQVIRPPFFVSSNQPTRFEIADDQNQSVSISMNKGGVIRGRLHSPNGSPIIGMPITALKVNNDSATTQLPQQSESNMTALSDDRGEFRVYGLRQGRYALAVNAQRRSYQFRSFATLYHPGEKEVSNARTFKVSDGEQIIAPDMLLDLNRAMQNTLSGTVSGSGSLPLEGVSLSLTQIDGGSVSDFSSTDEEGRFGFEGLPLGKYLLKARRDKGSYLSAEKEVTIRDQFSNDITLRMRLYPVITGHALVTHEKVVKPMSGLEIRLVPAKAGESLEFVSDKDGAFSTRASQQGQFWWSFPGLSQQNYLERIGFNGEDITHSPLTLDRVSDLNALSIQFASGAATIEGRFGGEERDNCSRYAVYAVGVGLSKGELLLVKKADKCSGDSFLIYSLAPGQYKVVALLIETNSARIQHPSSRSPAVNDNDYRIIKNAINNLDGASAALTLDKGQTYLGVAPVILKRDRIPRGSLSPF